MKRVVKKSDFLLLAALIFSVYLIVLFIVLLKNVSASQIIQCNSVSSCNSAITLAGSGDIVQLNSSLTGVSGTALNFTGVDGIAFDCQGHTISGTSTVGSYGILFNMSNHSVIDDCNISGFDVGIYLVSSSNNNFSNVTSMLNSKGVYVQASEFSTNQSGCGTFSSDQTSCGTFSSDQSGCGTFSSDNPSSCGGYQTTACGTYQTAVCSSGGSCGPAQNDWYYSCTGACQGSCSSPQTCNYYYTCGGSCSATSPQICNYYENCNGACTSSQSAYTCTYYKNCNGACSSSYKYSPAICTYYKDCSGNCNTKYSAATCNYYQDCNGQCTQKYTAANCFSQGSDNNTFTGLNSTSNSNVGIVIISSYNNTFLNSRIANSSNYGLEFMNGSNGNLFYNNVFNNTQNYHNSSSGMVNYFNTTLTLGTNIIGGSYIGGNLWDNFSAPGTLESGICIDINRDGVCDYPYSLDGVNYDYIPIQIAPPAKIIQCGTVSECNSALASANYGDIVQMNQSINYNQNGTAINLSGKDKIIFDCNNFNLTGLNNTNSTNYGVYLNGVSLVTVENCSIDGFYYGVYLKSALNNTISNVNSTSSYYGIFSLSSNFSTLKNINTSQNKYHGIFLQSSSNNILREINSNRNRYQGVYFYSGSSYNELVNSVTNFENNGIYFQQSSNYNSLSNLTANSNSNTGIYSTSQSSFNNITNLTSFNNTNIGVYIISGNNDTLNYLNISNCGDGLALSSSFNNFISNLWTSFGSTRGLYLYNSSRNFIYNANSSGNVDSGFYFYTNSSNNTISNSYILGNIGGIYLSKNSNFNIITNSYISGNAIGLYVNSSNNNSFYNNVINNTIDYQNLSAELVNYFNTTLTAKTNIVGGPKIGGNYWDNYSAPGSGFSGTCTDANKDGMCDLNYTLLDNKTVDYLPLTHYTAPKPSSTASSGSGGGGFAGGSSTSNVTTNQTRARILASADLTNASAGVPNTVKLSSSAAGITSFTVTTNQNVQNATITLFDVGSEVSDSSIQISFSGKTYQAFEVNLSGINDSQISNVIINFRVNKSWVESNNVNVSGIGIYRNPGNGTWTGLPTTFIGNDSQFYYFSALSPGFSIYAIFAKGNFGINSQEILKGAGNFFNSVTPSFFRQTTIGYIIYYLLLAVVLAGIVFVSSRLYKKISVKKKKKI